MDNLAVASKHEITRENQFFFGFSLLLLSIVIIGFSPSLFLRVFFEAEPIPLYLHLHGLILTGWFVCLVAQAWLIRSGNTALHRKMGVFAASYGALVVIGGLMATFNVVGRDLGNGLSFETDMAQIDTDLGVGITYLQFITRVVFLNIAAMISFSVLLGSAIYFRTRPEIHKRLVLFATVAILGPALARISRLDFLGGEQGPFVPAVIVTLLASIILYDVKTRKKPHGVSLIAAAFVLSMIGLGMMLNGTEFAQEFVRGMA